MITMKWLISVLPLVSCFLATAQPNRIDLKSGLIKIKIMTDVTPPALALNPVRNIEEGYSLVLRDTTVSLSGMVSDAGGVASLQINGVAAALSPSGKFVARVHLARGKNIVKFRAMDRKRNPADTTLIVYQDSYADTTAPQITITQPSQGRGMIMVKRTPRLRVAGTIYDDSPLASLSVNNIKLDSIRSGTFFCEVPTDSLHVVFVRAVDTCGNVAIDSVVLPPHYFSEESDNIDLPTSSRYFALLIGVDKYAYTEDLKHAVHDASRLGSILNSTYTFEKENIVFLKNPTRDKILEGFEQMKKKVGSEDNFLIFYAGHGYKDEDADQGYWWPSDAHPESHSKWISNSDIRDQVRRIKSKHTLLIADACFSGSVFNFTRDPLENAPVPILEAYRRASRTALTSGDEAVPDESVFSRLLLDALAKNPSRYIRASQLSYQFAEDVTSNSPNRQLPEYGKIQEAGDSGGDFVFIKRHFENSEADH